MITKKEYADILANKAAVENAAKAVLDKITELNLTPTTDIRRLKTEYQTMLFSKLVAADKGIKMQYELHKSDKAKLDLINRTISLDGYGEIEELESLMKSFLTTNPYFLKNIHFHITHEDFLVKFNGSIETALSGKVIDVTETELYKEFKQLADLLNDLYARGVICQYAFSNGFYMNLDKFLPANSFTKTVDINESAIFYYLKRKQ